MHNLWLFRPFRLQKKLDGKIQMLRERSQFVLLRLIYAILVASNCCSRDPDHIAQRVLIETAR